ncbi:hypothetical protein [Methylocystis echinoides]|uniref:Uncharacterized protein n=1 Tax=Methylocystis echinoides TaxID=29468 RepID=A0A9W6GTV2_9HYPH|nr:hypothetical protein [Methylocystis echinoides]GLI92760.1 hypothetical protein LMG27198_17520 [Methylocystis echinoides]
MKKRIIPTDITEGVEPITREAPRERALEDPEIPSAWNAAAELDPQERDVVRVLILIV